MGLLSSSPSSRPVRHRSVGLGAVDLRPLAVLVVAVLAVVGCSGSGGPDGDDQLAAGDDPGVVTGDGDEDRAEGEGEGDVPGTLFDGSVTVVVPNSPGTLSTEGRQRVLTALVGSGPNAYLGGPDLPVTVTYAHLDLADDDEPVTGEVEGRWLTTPASELGLYAAPFTFERAGRWQVTVSAAGREIGRALVVVAETSVVPTVGDPAPSSVSPTGSTVEEVAAFSSDPRPELGFYDLSLDEALANGRPTVLAFATPAFCRTALCGPTLEIVKAVTADRDDIDVVHIEPFDIEQAMGGVLEPIPVMDDWGLVTEPWVFVIDADGRIAASFEGIITREELEEALARL